MENCYHFDFKYKTIKWLAEGDQEKKIHEVRRPVVMVLLSGADGIRLAEPFLLDSGADNSFIKYDLAELLGLELSEKTVKVKTAGADIEVYTSRIEMGLVQGNGYCEISKEAPVFVFLKQKQDVPNIIGRTPLFDKFKITFQQYNGTVSLAFMAKVMARKIDKK